MKEILKEADVEPEIAELLAGYLEWIKEGKSSE